MQGFVRLWERICKDSETLGEDLQEFGIGFARIQETLGEDSQGFAKIHETLGEDLQGFMRLWERICKSLG